MATPAEYEAWLANAPKVEIEHAYPECTGDWVLGLGNEVQYQWIACDTCKTLFQTPLPEMFNSARAVNLASYYLVELTSEVTE